MNLKIIVFFALSCAFLSCEKEIELKLPEPETKFVVEGWIEQDQYAVVSITRNSPYFAKVDLSTLMNLFVLNAKVIVSDGSQSEELQIDYSNLQKRIWPFICYKGKVIKGEIGKTYWLTIYIDGDTITSKTTIPQPVFLDSIWWEPDKENKPDNDSLGYIWGIYNDDPSIRQYFRLFTYRRGRDKTFVPTFGSIFDDFFFSGKKYTFILYRGIPVLTDEDSIYTDKELFYFKKNDTVDVKITTIDKEHYDFWRTIEQEIYTGGNPFMYPVTIRHNVKGALGVWGGYCATYYTLVIGE